MTTYMNFVSEAKNMQGFVLAAFTDEYFVGCWPEETKAIGEKEDKLLEIRVFNEEAEIKMFRSDLGKDFSKIRILDDEKDDIESFCQTQFLDIDTTKQESDSKVAFATGGGKYSLPVKEKEDAKIIIKYYIRPNPETGLAELIDWRVAGFQGGAE